MNIKITTTAPTDSDTTTLFSTVSAFGAYQLPIMGIKRFSFSTENSHAGTLKAYRSTNGGTNWDQVGGDIAVAAAAATDISGPYDFLVDTFIDWKLDWVNGGTTQTTWRPEMHGHDDRAPGA